MRWAERALFHVKPKMHFLSNVAPRVHVPKKWVFWVSI